MKTINLKWNALTDKDEPHINVQARLVELPNIKTEFTFAIFNTPENLQERPTDKYTIINVETGLKVSADINTYDIADRSTKTKTIANTVDYIKANKGLNRIIKGMVKKNGLFNDINEDTPKFIDSKEAFTNAINTDKLSGDIGSENYAGHYMYMHSYKGTDHFKHSMTKNYMEVSNNHQKFICLNPSL
jgi:hypothetical protein